MNIHFLQSRTVVSKYIRNIDEFWGCSFYPSVPDDDNILVTFSPYEKESMRYALKWMINGRGVISIQDGVYDFCSGFTHPFFSNSYKLYYPAVSNVVIAGNTSDCKIIKALNPFADVYSYRLPSSVVSGDALMKSNNAKLYDVLITTANTSYFSDYEMNSVVELINETVKYLEFSGLSFCFRIFDGILANRISALTTANNKTEGSFSDVLTLCRSVVSTPSTVVVETMAHDVPVAVYIYRDFPVSVQGGWIIRDTNSISGVIQGMLSKPNARMDIQRAILQGYIDVDYEFLTPDLLKSLVMDTPKFSDVAAEFSLEMLNSRWNLNFKYIAKRVYYRLFK
ncbi:hypothetical protein ACQUQU_08890 [Thalassolituus sp. LLYu03]|uniref:hypothetical protein n=1 Tax=Thalassolituus sp. LLYu03 TaxID=3421656 RepID=UPI003D289B52